MDEDLLSISSEAFGLLLLENHWDRWLDIYQKCGGKIGYSNGKKTKEVVSRIQPRYTRGGLKNGKNETIGIGKGWSIEGIYRFNVLFHFVMKDRDQNPNFISTWLKQNRSNAKKKNPKSLKFMHNGPFLRMKIMC